MSDSGDEAAVEPSPSPSPSSPIPEPPHIEPITDTSEMTFDIRPLNQHLQCGLCCGYLREAYTVMECLHSFCHSCLDAYFYEYAHYDDIHCPYNNQLGAHPEAHLPMVYTRKRRRHNESDDHDNTPTKKWQGKNKVAGGGRGTTSRQCSTTFKAVDPLRIHCRLDRILQQFVDKLLVEYAQSDEQLRRSIMGDHGHSSTLTRISSEMERKKRSMEEALSGTFIIVELQPDPQSSLKPLSHPIIKVPSRICIKHIRKYLLQTLSMDETTPMDLIYNSQILGSDHSLEFIKRTRWHDQSHHILIKYRPKHIPS